MEILPKPPTQFTSTRNYIHDLRVQQAWEPLSALLCTLRDATYAHMNDEHRSWLLGSLKALQIQESVFRPVLKNLTIDWAPTAEEESIIQAASSGRYPVTDIKGAFYRYGGLYGIIALVMAFRRTNSILQQWADIEVKAAQQWLVSNVSQLFSVQRNDWILTFVQRGTQVSQTYGCVVSLIELV